MTPRVAILMETSLEVSRNMLRGIIRYIREHGNWTLDLTPGGIADQHLPDNWNGNGLYFENVTFDGGPTALAPSGFGFAIQNKNGGTVKGKDIGNLTYINCVITNYTKGLIYEWGNDMKLGDVTYSHCDITNINVDGTVGGDVFDIRQATSIASLTFEHNTIAQGMRTFIRQDAGSLGALHFINNTLYNLCFVDNANNAGIFGLQVVPGEFIFRNNLFLGMTGKATLESANVKYKSAADMSVSAANNYFWSLPVGDDGSVTYFTDNFTLAQAAGVILDEAPCYNAAGGYFNILNTSEIAGKNIGASKWWTPYVEEPEDLTMVTVPVPHTWNLGNAKYFSGNIKKEMVRDYLFVSASEALPIVAANGMLNFLEPVIVNRQGVPQHNYVAFHTDVPGSLVIKVDNPANYTSHLVVGVGPVDGSSITIKGGVSALAEQGNATKILITSITEESVVYIYPSGPVSLSQLSWTADVTPVNTALPTPNPVADPPTFTAGQATDVLITWDPVENAASYSVVFNGKTSTVNEPEFVIGGTTTSMLDPQGKDEIKKVIRGLHEESGLTILSITHDIDEVAGSDYVVALDGGKVVMTGTPHEVFGDEQKLRQMKLDVPFSLKFARELAKAGVKTDKHITMEGLVEELCRYRSNM